MTRELKKRILSLTTSLLTTGRYNDATNFSSYIANYIAAEETLLKKLETYEKSIKKTIRSRRH